MNFGFGTTRFQHPQFREIQVSCDGASLDHIWISAYGAGLSPDVVASIDKLATIVWPRGALGTGRRATECLRKAITLSRSGDDFANAEVPASTASGVIQCTFSTTVKDRRPFMSVTLARTR